VKKNFRTSKENVASQITEKHGREEMMVRKTRLRRIRRRWNGENRGGKFEEDGKYFWWL
jgi:hypothetical protein